jgi:uncharacterized protein (DUF1697 family)
MSTAYVALLRGINVGGKNKLPMSDLRTLFTEAGCDDVQTYIQSGNVVFRGEPDMIAALPETVTAQIAARFGYRTPIVVRSAAQMDDVIWHNPFIAQGAKDDELHVLFLTEAPDARRIAPLDPDRSPPDTFAVRGQEVYLRLPNGMGRTKLTNDYFDRILATTSTARNWRTVTKLRALMPD